MVIIAIAGYIGYKRGIVKMLVGGLTVAMSTALAYLLASPLAHLVYGLFFENTINASVEAAFEGKTVETATTAVQSLIGSNNVLSGMAGWLGFDPQTASQITGATIADIAYNVKEQVIVPAMILMLKILIFVVLLFILLFLLGLAASALCRLAKAKSIKGFNAVSGAIVGVLIGALFSIGICFILNLWMQSVNPNGLFGINEAIRGNSVVYLLIHNTLLTL